MSKKGLTMNSNFLVLVSFRFANDDIMSGKELSSNFWQNPKIKINISNKL